MNRHEFDDFIMSCLLVALIAGVAFRQIHLVRVLLIPNT